MVGTVFPVIVKGIDRVWELQKTIKKEAVEIFGDLNAAQLRVYLARKDNDEWLTPTEVKNLENGDVEPAKTLLDKGHLASMSQLAEIFKDPVANVVHAIAGAEAIPVSTEELRRLFDVLGQKKPTQQKLIATSGLSEFWRGYGGFPSSYFVRKEELILWGLVIRLMSERNKRVAIVGSAGVGKSCFLMLVSFYLAFVEKRKVLVVRRLRDFYGSHAVVYLDGESNTCTRNINLTTAKISSLPDRKEFQGALILVDGYSRKEMDHQFGFFPYQLLTSSMEDSFVNVEPSTEVVLPAWQFADLQQFAESTVEDWKESTGFGQKCNNTRKLVKKQYFYSGGSLRDFCRYRGDVENKNEAIFGVLSTNDVKLQLSRQYTSDPLSGVRRHYVLDPSNEDDYWLVSRWKLVIDSGYAYKSIGWYMDESRTRELYQFAYKHRSGFWGSVYEVCLHEAIRHSTKRSPLQVVNVVVNSDPSYSNQRYDRIEIHGPTIELAVCAENDWYERLSKSSRLPYWHYDCIDYSFAYGVAICEAVLRGTNIKETIIAIISTTVSDKKTFKPEVWSKLNKALDDNRNISSSIPRVFVMVGPEASTCKRFSLMDHPPSNDFMVCCYDPQKLYRNIQKGRIA
ncbi:Crinkler (CRN) [Phytophthora megakarya]|uniref:Crinkler (CRN) n=1 Tax=Phytophthora megakarya TaxID=4795 RepID=A0A225X5R0_9STRA|nr:Crinkler (CRN) [Phytophthora megakarya]